MIGVVGISHKTAAQDVRGLFAFTKEEIVLFSEQAKQTAELKEMVLLSTCNRTEIYFYREKSCNKKTSKMLIELLHTFKKAPLSYTDSFYYSLGIDAVQHLFRVTSGMDSIVIGEDQIVSQVKEAFTFCSDVHLTDIVLTRLFQKCLEASKRVRTETALQQGATSVSHVAVDLCAKIFSDLSEKSVLFVGSGETGSLALHNMVKRGVTRTFISNRTYDKAQALASEYSGQAIAFEEFKNYMPLCDIVIVATGAPNYLIYRTDIEASIAARNNNPQIFIDLSVPRNIEKEGNDPDHAKLFAVDDLQEIVDSNTGRRKQSIEQAQIIINEMAEDFMLWFESLILRPLIKTITLNMQKIRETEMGLYKNSEDELKFKIIDEYTNRITQKYIGMLIKNLKEVTKGLPSSHSLNVINELFMFEKN